METPFCILGEYKYYLELLKVFGIFPFRIIYDNKYGNVIQEVTFHKSGVYFWLNRLTMAVAAVNFAFTLFRGLGSVVEGSGSGSMTTTVYMYLVAWTSAATVSLTIQLILVWKKVKICCLFNHWIQVENAILFGIESFIH
jgi:hypothetical protein